MNKDIQARIARITELYEADQLSGRQAFSKNEVPISYEAITTEWLTDVICSDVPDAKVTDFALGEIDDGSSNRRRIYLTYNAAGREGGFPATAFCKASFALLNRVMLGVSDCARTEINFYRNVRPEMDIEAPRAIYANYDPDSFVSIVMLEDLGSDIAFGNHLTDMNFERGANQVRLLARVHSQFYQDRRLLDGSFGLKSWKEMWQNQVDNELERYSNLGFLAAEDVIPARLFAQYDKIWRATAKSVEVHGSRPQTLTHCDVHLKNWYICDDAKMGLADWQVASCGHWSRDIAYAIATAFPVEDRRKWDRDLFALYCEEMKRGGVPMPEMDVAWDYFRQQLFSALAFWTVTLRHAPSMPDMQPEDVTLEFIKRIATAIDDHDALSGFDREVAYEDGVAGG